METSRENIEMSDVRTKDRTTHSRPFSRTSFILIAANILLSIVILIMVILVFAGYQESSLNESNELNKDSPSTMDDVDKPELTLLERFPGYFRTQEEHDRLVAGLVRRKPVNISTVPANCTTGLDNPGDIPWCVLTPSESTFHSCCLSDIKYESPDYKYDKDGILRKLAKFDGQRQFFRSETCSQLTGCQFCICKVEETLYTGVYDTEEVGSSSRYGVAFFKFDGCCKCYT